MNSNEQVQIRKLPEDVKLWVDLVAGGELLPPTEAKAQEGAAGVDAHFTIVIGQRIQHVAHSNVPITGVRWAIEGLAHTVADYTVSTNLGQKTMLTQADLANNPITFCWWRGGHYTVTCTIDTVYGSGQVTHSFEVTSPQVRDFSAITGVVGVGTYRGASYLRFAFSMPKFDMDGIYMTATVAGTQNCLGSIAGIQLASNQRFCTLTNGQSYRLDTNGMPILDVGLTNSVFYQNHAVAIAHNHQDVHYEVNDGPGAELNAAIIRAMFIGNGDDEPHIPESYQLHLMFCPHVAGAIWVPIKVLSWGWEGYTQHTDGHWQPAEDTEVSAPVDSNPVDFPQWNQNTAQSQWVRY